MRPQHWLYTVPLRLRSLFRRDRVEQELEEEFRDHVERQAEEFMARGMAPEDARLAARRSLGGIEQRKEECRDTRRVSLLENFFRDLRFALRLLGKSPGFAAVAILSLALGTGANAAIFELLNAVRLRALPVSNPQELARVVISNGKARSGRFTGEHPDLTYGIWSYIRDHQKVFSGLAAWGVESFNLTSGGEAQYAHGLLVSGSFFDALAVRPVLGRVFSSADDQPGCSAGAVLSYAFWQRQFGGRASVVGEKLMLEGHAFPVIGITSPDFFGVEVGRNFDVAIPLCAEPVIDTDESALAKPHWWWLSVIGRLKPGMSAQQASAQLAAMSPALFENTLPPRYDAEDRKNYLNFKLAVTPAPRGISNLRRDYESPLWLLMGIAGAVLLIACANLANLMLARASARQREMAVRLALGANRGRLIRQALAESLLLAGIGTACGAVAAQGLSRFMLSFMSTQSSRVFVALHFDWRMLAFTAGLAALTCILFGLAPALQASQTAPAEAMKAGGRTQNASGARLRFRRALVVAQVALSLVLLVSALLFTRSLSKLLTIDAGFQQDHLLVTQLDFSSQKLPEKQRIVFKRQLLERIRAVPGVSSAADAFIVPVIEGFWNDMISMPGTSVQRRVVDFNQVSSGYFKTMGIPLLAGRDFNELDTASSPLVAIVDETWAKRLLGNSDPLGRIFHLPQEPGKPDLVFQIVGVVKASKYEDLRKDPSPLVFIAGSQAQESNSSSKVMVRTEEPTEVMIPALRQAVGEISPSTVLTFKVFRTSVREGLLRERLMATLSGFFGFLAAVLAMVGLYGLISYMVAQRRHEIGLRMALGAKQRDIQAMILRHAAMLLAIGLALGTGLALVAAPALRSLLFGLQPTDPPTFLLAGLTMAVVALIASLIPAYRAARVDPMVALRDE